MINFGKRLTLLLMLFVLGSFVTDMLGMLLARVLHDEATAVRITAMVQDICVFILPAVVLALLSTRLPAEFLGLKRPGAMLAALGLCTLLCSIPAMNALVQWNGSWPLSGEFGEAMRALEESAARHAAMIYGGDTLSSLIIGVLIVGVMAGLSEELFFRGALQRVLELRPMNPHLAVWLAAAVFSAIHMQVLGFVPRLLLGAFFGYSMLWSGSVWIPVMLHVCNNSLVVLAGFMYRRGVMTTDPDMIGVGSWTAVCLSVALTAAGLWLMYRQSAVASRKRMSTRPVSRRNER